MVIMRILGLSVDTTAKTPILLLQEEGDKRVLPIWIGSMEAMNISLALSGKGGSRPLTHDLGINLIDTLGAHIESLEITNFSEGTFYADLVVRQGDKVFRVDCRPSDGVTMAVKQGLPIYVHPEVLENASHAEQRQDAASFHVMRDEELKTFKEFQGEKEESEPTKAPSVSGTIKKKGPRIQHVTMTVQPKAHVKTLIEGSNEKLEEQDLEKLLKNLDPASNTRM